MTDSEERTNNGFERRRILEIAGVSATGTFASTTGSAEVDDYIVTQDDGLNLNIRQITRPTFPEVTAFASVTNNGDAITGLGPGDFTLAEDGASQSITEVAGGQEGNAESVSVSLIIDRSTSMRGGALADAKTAAQEFVNQFEGDDEGLVIDFGSGVNIRQRWTKDQDTLTDAISAISDSGSTALWDATSQGVSQAEPRPGRSAVITLTDGQENNSSTTLSELIDEAQGAGIPVYTIGLGSGVDENNLTTLASETGGDYYQAPDSSDLVNIYNQISQSLASEYQITYNTTNTATDGTERSVSLEVSSGGSTASDTGTYEAPCAPLPTAAFNINPSPAKVGQEVSFDASSSSPNGGTLAVYDWDFNNNGVTDASGEQVTNVYDEAGTYEARLTVEKSCGASDLEIKEVKVSNADFSINIVDTNAPIDAGNTLTITAEVTNNTGSQDIQGVRAFVEGVASPPGQQVDLTSGETRSVTFEIPTEIGDEGTYTASVESNEGVDTTEVTINESPTVSLQISIVPSIPTAGEEVTFDATEIEGDIQSYEWNFGDGTTATGDVVTHTYTEPGSYTIELAIDRSGSIERGTATINVAEKDDLGDGGVTADFDYAPRSPETMEPITFDANLSNGPIDEYSWEFGDGEAATGKRTEYQYSEASEYEVTLRVADVPNSVANGEKIGISRLVLTDRETEPSSSPDTVRADIARATVDVSIGTPYTGFAISNREPDTSDVILFDSGIGWQRYQREGLSVEWQFGDGTSAEGPAAQHQYEFSGTYTVTMEAAGETTAREIEVSDPPVEITNVDRRFPGKLLPELQLQETFDAEAETRSDTDLDRIEYEFNGSTKTTNASPYAADYEIDKVTSPSEPLTIRAVTTDGAIHEIEERIPIEDLPGWAETIFNIAGNLDIEETDNGGIRITYDPLAQYDFLFQLSPDTLGGDDNDVNDNEQQFNFDASVGGTYDPFTNTAELQVSAEGNADLMQVEVGLGLTGTGRITNLELVRLTAEPQLQVTIIPRTAGPIPLSIPVPGSDASIGVEPEITLDLSGEFEFDGQMEFDQGTVFPTLEISITLGFDINVPFIPIDVGEIQGGPTGTIDTSFDVGQADLDFSGTFTLSGSVTINPPGPWFYQIEGTIYEQDLVGGGVSSLMFEPEDIKIQQPTAGGQQPLPEIQSVDDIGDVGEGLETADTGKREGFRLSDRPREDGRPVIAVPAGDQQLIAWERQADNKTIEEGHDIVARWREQGAWQQTVTITDDRTANVMPVASALDNGRVLVAWRRFTEVLSESGRTLDDRDAIDGYRTESEIAYSIYDGNSWSSPILLTDTSRVERKPTVASGDDGWVIAWQSTDVDANDPRVRSVTVEADGTAGSISERGDADAPATGTRQDGQVDLVYFDRSTDTRRVVHERIPGGPGNSPDVYTAQGSVEIAVSDGRVIWVSNPRNDPELVEASDGTVTNLALREDAAEISEVTLTNSGGRTILSYLSVLEDSENRDQVYRLDRGNGWIQDRRVAGETEQEVAFRHTDAEFVESNRFLTTYSIRNRSTDAVSDVFATEQEFAPAYAIDADITPGSAGEQTTLSYSVENRGDTAGTSPVTVEVERDGQLFDSNSLGPLGPGETQSVNQSVVVGEGGVFTLSLETSEATLGTEPKTVEVVAATPELRVGRLSARRIAADEATVEVPIVNDGGAAVEDVTIQLSDGAGPIETLTADRVDPERTARLETAIDPATLANSKEHQIQIDPDGVLPEESIGDATRKTYLVRPNLSIDQILFRSDDKGPFVRVVVSNTGPGDGVGTLEIRYDDGAGLVSAAINLDPAFVSGGGEQFSSFAQIDIRVSGLSTGQTVSAVIEPAVNDLDPESLQRAKDVEAILPGEFEGAFGPEDPIEPYRNEDGIVTTALLNQAIVDLQSGAISTNVLRNVMDAWRTS
jgi:VWFA-related protein